MTAFLCRRRPPLGPMPNEHINVRNQEKVDKYLSYTRYLKQAEEAKNKPAWWKTYRGYVEQDDPDHGEKNSWSGALFSDSSNLCASTVL